MPRFFLPGAAGFTVGGELTLLPEDARHIALSLRMAVGDALIVSDGEGNDACCRLESISPSSVSARVTEVRRGEGEPPLPIYLYMGYAKGDKIETVIQKAVELGVSEVIPFFSSRCIRRPAGEKNARLGERYNKIAREAAGQCGRSRLPKVAEPLSFPDMLKAATTADLALFCYEGEGTEPLSRLLPAGRMPGSVAVVVGSEGGFSPEEAAAAAAAGCRLTGLGKRILRCETAPLFALSCLAYVYDLGNIGKIE